MCAVVPAIIRIGIQSPYRWPAEGLPILPHPHPSVVFREVSDGAVLLQMQDEIYFGLNEVGARVWQLLPPECRTVDELCERLRERYPEIPPDQIRADVEELLGQFREHRLLQEHA